MSSARDGAFCPYVGLEPFTDEHADYYFGREADATVLAENVLTRPITVLYGPSGVGKSSLLAVGLPRAVDAHAPAVQYLTLAQWHAVDSLVAWLRPQLKRTRPWSAPVILVLDQFEEYFLYQPADGRHPLVELIQSFVSDQQIDAHVLVALRDDALHRLDGLRLYLPELLDTTLELRHLGDAGVREAIEKPIEIYNARKRRRRKPVEIEAGFVDRLFEELRAAEPASGDARPSTRIELPFLQLALTRMWDAEGGAAATRLSIGTLTSRLQGVGKIAEAHVDEIMGG